MGVGQQQPRPHLRTLPVSSIISAMIYHIAHATDWQVARQHGSYVAPSLATEGFIHCATVTQVAGVAARFYRGVPNLVLLSIDTARLTAEVRYEAPAEAPDSPERFPHVYGSIPLAAITQITPLQLAANGIPTPIVAI